MSEQLASPSVPAIKLWTPRVILFVSVFLSWPGGIVLASLNWFRMGITKKATTHLIAGIVGTLALLVMLFFLPGQAGGWLGVFISLGIATYLHINMKNDIARYKAANHMVQNENWFLGGLIGLAGLVVFVLLAFIIGFLLTLVGIV